MDVRGFVAIRRVEEEPVWPEPKNRWQRIPVYMVTGGIAKPIWEANDWGAQAPGEGCGCDTGLDVGTKHVLRNTGG